MVQETVVVAEDVPLGDGVVGVVGSEFRQCPIGDVLLSVGAIFIVCVERKALPIAYELDIWNNINYQRLESFVTSNATDTNHSILRFGF